VYIALSDALALSSAIFDEAAKILYSRTVCFLRQQLKQEMIYDIHSLITVSPSALVTDCKTITKLFHNTYSQLLKQWASETGDGSHRFGTNGEQS
jgi:hypothetical protein